MRRDERTQSVRDREALAFLRRGRPLRGLSPGQIGRIERLLERRSRTPARRPWLPVLALGAVALLASTAAAHLVDLARLPLVGALFAPARPARTVPVGRAVRPPGRAAVAATPAPPAAQPPPAPADPPELAPAHPVPVAVSHHPRAPSPPAAVEAEEPAPGSSITDESRSFLSALADWRRDHDGDAALAALDVHERRFPHGQIRWEARILRAEILLGQGRQREALAALEDVPLTGLPRGRELQTIRGELRVELRRCSEGRADLAAVLAGGSADDLGRRAARAMSACP